MDNVFAYGILMQDADCPAVLHGYRLDFGGFATVVPQDGCVVYGVLIRDVGLRLRSYDGIEGYRPDDPSRSFYTRKQVAVVTPEGPERAWAYEMNARDLAAAKVRQGRDIAAYGEEGDVLGGLPWRMKLQYERLGHGDPACEELDLRVREWIAECREIETEIAGRLWAQDARP